MEMKQAKCIKKFITEKCDDDGFTIENQDFIVEKDTIWDVEENAFRIASGEVRLTNDKLGWLEISKENFEKDFDIE